MNINKNKIKILKFLFLFVAKAKKGRIYERKQNLQKEEAGGK
jgi:hypothetical protein